MKGQHIRRRFCSRGFTRVCPSGGWCSVRVRTILLPWARGPICFPCSSCVAVTALRGSVLLQNDVGYFHYGHQLILCLYSYLTFYVFEWVVCDFARSGSTVYGVPVPFKFCLSPHFSVAIVMCPSARRPRKVWLSFVFSVVYFVCTSFRTFLCLHCQFRTVLR